MECLLGREGSNIYQVLTLSKAPDSFIECDHVPVLCVIPILQRRKLRFRKVMWLALARGRDGFTLRLLLRQSPELPGIVEHNL